MDDFSKAKAGDKLWRLDFNDYVKVRHVYDTYLLCTGLEEHETWSSSLNLDGTNEHGAQVLFWDKPEIIAPLRPKQMIKKEATYFPYLKLHPKTGEIECISMYPEDIKFHNLAQGWVRGEKVTIHYEVEEETDK